jgi:hypothetical protein
MKKTFTVHITQNYRFDKVEAEDKDAALEKVREDYVWGEYLQHLDFYVREGEDA